MPRAGTAAGSSARKLFLLLSLVAGAIWGIRFTSTIVWGNLATTTGTENMNTFNISRIRHGEPAYANCFEHPYRTSMYNWLFYYSYAGAASLAGAGELNLATVLRLLTTLWAMAGCAAMFAFLRRFAAYRADPLFAFCVAFVAWFGPTVGWWTLTARADMAAVALETAATFLLIGSWGRISWRTAVCAAMLFFVAWSFKQSSVTLLAGLFVALVATRQWMPAMVVPGLFTAAVLFSLALATADYWNNVVIAPTVGRFRFSLGLDNATTWLLAWGFLLLLPIGLKTRVADEPTRAAVKALIMVFVVSLVFGLVGACREGASRNYYFPAWIVGMAAVGLVAASGELKKSVMAIAALGSLGYAVMLLHPSHRFGVLIAPKPDIPAAMLASLATDERPIFCDEPNIVRLALPDDAGDVPVLEPLILNDALRKGIVKDGGVDAHIAQHYYATIWAFDNSSWAAKARGAGYVSAGHEGRWERLARPNGRSSN